MTWFIVQSLITLVPAFALGVVVGWLVWARRRPADAGVSAEPAAAEEPLAACACDAGTAAADDADLDADDAADLAADDGAVEPEPRSDEADDTVVTAEDVDIDDLVATYEALEEVDTDLDSPTVSTDGGIVEAEAETDADDVAALAVAVGALSQTADPDDIERIEGIGPKIGKALRAAGLDTYTAIAGASQESLREAIKAGGVRTVPNVESWSSQARLLADGDEAGFKALTGRLVADRVKD